MLFPKAPLALAVSIAPGAQPADDPDVWEAAGLWTNITSDVRIGDGVTIEQGRTDEANQVDAGKCSLVVDNRSGNYSPRNPSGIYYGLLRKNTPIKVELTRVTDTFNRTVSNSWGTSDDGQAWGSSGSSLAVSPATGATATLVTANTAVELPVSGAGSWNADTLVSMSVATVPAGAGAQFTVMVRRTSLLNSYAATLIFNTTGTIDALIQRYTSSSTITVMTTTGALTGYTANKKVWVRARTRGDRIQMKCWYDGGAEPGAWTVSFKESNDTLDYDASGSVGRLGAGVSLYFWRYSGNTNTTQFNTYSFVLTVPLFVGNVVEWPVRWDKSANDATVPIAAAGIIRRLSQGQSPLNSPLYKTMFGATPYAYWPLEDEAGSTTAQGIGTGVKPASVFGATFDWELPALGGATSTVNVTQNMTISAPVPKFSPLVATSGWQVNFFLLMSALPPVGQDATVMVVRSSGTITQYLLSVTSLGQLKIITADATGVLSGAGTLSGAMSAGVWYGVQLEAFQAGTDVNTIISTINMNTGVTVSSGFLTAATISTPTGWALYGSSTSFPAGSVAHVAFYNHHSVFDNTRLYRAAIGYLGESPPDRVVRLCAEQNVLVTVLGSSSTQMGPQKSDTFLNLLRECETAEIGILYETVHVPGFGFRSRSQRTDSTARLLPTFAAGQIAEPPEPTDDDQNVRNDWTVSRVDGSAARVSDEVHVALQGRYDDTIEINVSTDDVLVDQAAFRVHLGTADELRWPSIELNLAKSTSLTANWASSSIGSRLTISDNAPELPGVAIDLFVEGYTQKLSAYDWDVQLNCSPAKPWAGFGSAADAAAPVTADVRLDSALTTANAGISSSATSLVVLLATDAAIWNSTAVPFDVGAAGERMTVTAISGSGPTQTWTVTRSVNAIVKAHVAGETVSLWMPSYLAL